MLPKFTFLFNDEFNHLRKFVFQLFAVHYYIHKTFFEQKF